jgi:hypothetical protein
MVTLPSQSRQFTEHAIRFLDGKIEDITAALSEWRRQLSESLTVTRARSTASKPHARRKRWGYACR